ncbi:MAG: hypothetical protein AAFW73_20305 [Bacteroidota bacterium]|mgnify:CR=1 FL=1
MQYRRTDINPFNSIRSILFLVLFFVALFFVARGIFTLLSWVAPVLLILTLVLDYKTIIDYGKWLGRLIRKDLLMGVGAIILTVVGFPVIAGFLFFKALIRRKVGQVKKDMEERAAGQYIEFEEVESTTYEPLELPPLDTPQAEPEPQPETRRSTKNDYDDLFE